MNTLNTRLKELRVKEKLTQIKFAERIGLTKAHVAQWEVGNNYPKLENLIRICDEFDVSLDWLVRGIETKTPPVTTEGVKSAEELTGLMSYISDFENEQRKVLSKIETIKMELQKYASRPQPTEKQKAESAAALAAVREYAAGLKKVKK